MDFNEALEARVTAAEALRELKRHGFTGACVDGAIVADGETVAKAGADGLYAGGAVLGWLGY